MSLATRYQPQRALDLFSSRIGAKPSQVKKNAVPVTSASQDDGSHVVAKTTEKKNSIDVVSHPSRNPYSWSTVVDALSLDEPHHAVPQGRNPIGASRAADEVKSLPGWDGALPSKHFSGYVRNFV